MLTCDRWRKYVISCLLLNYLNFNLLKLINEVKPNSFFFKESFKHYINCILTSDDNFLFDFKNKNNIIEKHNLFQKSYTYSKNKVS